MGSLSVQWLSRNSWCSFSSVSGSTSRGVERSKLTSLRDLLVREGRVRPSTTSCMTGRPVTGIVAVDVGAQLCRGLAHDRLRHEDLALRGIPFTRATDRTTFSKMSVCSATVGTPYLLSSVIACTATAGAQVLQWPTPTIAACPFSLISSQVAGSSLV